MKILGKNLLELFAKNHPTAWQPLEKWKKLTTKSTWYGLEDIRKTFKSADCVNRIYIFNIHGNDYRLLLHIIFTAQTVQIQDILTHTRYSKLKL